MHGMEAGTTGNAPGGSRQSRGSAVVFGGSRDAHSSLATGAHQAIAGSPRKLFTSTLLCRSSVYSTGPLTATAALPTQKPEPLRGPTLLERASPGVLRGLLDGYPSFS